MLLFFRRSVVGLEHNWSSRTGVVSTHVLRSWYRIYRYNVLNGVPGSCYNILRSFSSVMDPEIPWRACSSMDLLSKLEKALKKNHVEEAWASFTDYKNLHGFPKQSIVRRLIVALSYSPNKQWLHKGYELAIMVLKEKKNLLHYDSLAQLLLSLARCQIPVAASTIMRIMLEKYNKPSMDMCHMVLLHMVKSEIGSHLASNILLEICEHFLNFNASSKGLRQLNTIKPSTLMFNIVLSSCIQFGNVLKGQKVIDMMACVGAVADANSVALFARFYETNGQRDNFMNLLEHVNCKSLRSSCHLQLFYDCLLSLHFKFNDIDSAANVMQDLYMGSWHHNFNDTMSREPLSGNPLQIQVGSSYLNTGYIIKVKSEELSNDFVLQTEVQYGLVMSMDGMIVPSSKALTKLICGYSREGRVDQLVSFLAKIYKESQFSGKAAMCVDVVSACIQLGWLEMAHDLLDNFESENIPLDPILYKMLLHEYHMGNLYGEAEVLVKQMRKAHLTVSIDGENGASPSFQKGSFGNSIDAKSVSLKKSELVDFLEAEKKSNVQASQLLHELNSSICFFCKCGMVEDAMRTFRKMQESGLQPTIQTFSYLVRSYGSLEMYREVTILWGEIKRRLEIGALHPNWDLLDYLLWNFVRGGYFERTMEIIALMASYNMHIDKWKYQREFLKLHRSLYRNLRLVDVTTDAQKKRFEHVQAFRRWAGIGVKTHKGLP